MKIRAARKGDERSIAQVIINSWKDSYKGIVPQNFLNSLTTENHEALFKQQLAENTHIIHALETERNEIVGVVSGGKDSSGKYDCEIVAIYLEKQFQKRGFGKRLFYENIRQYKRLGYRKMIIWTFKENREREFYERLGGVATESQTYHIGGEALLLVGFVWEDINRVRLPHSS